MNGVPSAGHNGSPDLSRAADRSTFGLAATWPSMPSVLDVFCTSVAPRVDTPWGLPS
jgi:hypothetical protein